MSDAPLAAPRTVRPSAGSSARCCDRGAGRAALALARAGRRVGRRAARAAAARRDRRPRDVRRRPGRDHRAGARRCWPSAVAEAVLTALGLALVAGARRSRCSPTCASRSSTARCGSRVERRRARRPRRPRSPASATTSPSRRRRPSSRRSRRSPARRSPIVLTFVGLAAIDVRLAARRAARVPDPARRAALVPARGRGPRTRPSASRSGERAQALLDVVGGARTVRALGLADSEPTRVARPLAGGVDAVAAHDRGSRPLLLAAQRRRARRRRSRCWSPASCSSAPDALSIGGADRRRAALRAALRPVQRRARPVDDAQRALAALARLVGVAASTPPADPAAPPAPAGAVGRARAASATPTTPGTSSCTTSTSTSRPASASRSSASPAPGKTTLAKIVAGFHAPTAGTIAIGGACRSPRSARRRRGAPSRSSPRRSTSSPARSPTTCASPRPTPTDDELAAALELVGALDWVERAARRSRHRRRRRRRRAHRRRRPSRSRSRASRSRTRRSRCSTRRRRRRAAPAPACSRLRPTACSPAGPRWSSPTG